jgi:hypothetical protein
VESVQEENSLKEIEKIELIFIILMESDDSDRDNGV